MIMTHLVLKTYVKPIISLSFGSLLTIATYQSKLCMCSIAATNYWTLHAVELKVLICQTANVLLAFGKTLTAGLSNTRQGH